MAVAAELSVCGVNGGTGLPPESSDGVFDRNRLPPNSETSVIGELYHKFNMDCPEIIVTCIIVVQIKHE